MKDKLSFAAKLEDIYSPYFDITKNININGITPNFQAELHVKNEKYFLIPSANLWTAQTHEYVYVLAQNFGSLDEFKNARDTLLYYAMDKINPNKEHMYTYITIVLISDFINTKIEKEIRKFKKYKSFLFSFHGWMHFRMIALDIERNKIIYNPMGKDLKDTVSSLL